MIGQGAATGGKGKQTFMQSTPIIMDPRLQKDVYQDEAKINVGLTVNHAPLGTMLKHRTRHDLLMRAGEKQLAGSLYPLDKNVRYTALNTGLNVRRDSKDPSASESELPSIKPKKAAGWSTSKAMDTKEVKRDDSMNLFRSNPAESFNSFSRLDQ